MPFPTPQSLGLPYDAWRTGQRTAIRAAMSASTSHIVINAPTGSGKSAIATALPRLAPDRRHVILTATKGLMDQYGPESFPFLTDLRGASNYRCHAAMDEMREWFPIKRREKVRCDDGPCHVGIGCSLKESGCDYFDAKRAFIASRAGLTNYSAWLANRRMGQGLGSADVLVCDEAHALPEQLMQACGVDVPHYLLDGKATPKGYKNWARWALERLDHLAASADDHRQTKREQLTRALKTLSTMDETWAWDVGERGYRFEPTIPRLLLPLLQTFDGTSKIVYLSATITPSMLDLLGVDADDITTVTLPSSFPVERRPIYVVPGVRNDYRSMQHQENRDRLAVLIDDYCELFDDRRGIVHSVSFTRGKEIYEQTTPDQRYRMLLHERGMSASTFLSRFYDAGPLAIAVSPSLMTGFNFPYKLAEFQLIPKLPFPNTQSNIMRARIRSTPRYRDHHTMTHLVQACGRINRADDDQGETVILDGHFAWWYRDNRDLAPEWFDEAIVQTRRPIVPMKRLS